MESDRHGMMLEEFHKTDYKVLTYNACGKIPYYNCLKALQYSV